MSLHKKFMFSFFTLIFLSFSSFSFADEYVAGDVIVVLKNPDSGVNITASSFGSEGAGTLRASEFAVSSRTSVAKVYPALSEAGNNIFALIHSDDIDPEEFSKELLKNPNVIAASPNYIVRAAVVPNDTYMSYLWGLEAVNMPSAWDKEKGSSTVYVAVVDSGIDWTNPDLTANVARDLGFTAQGITSTQAGLDNYGHGTHVAGTIGAVSGNEAGVAGINWYVRMIPVKVLDSSGSGTTDTVLEGMNYVANLMSEGYNIRAVNLSLETYVVMTPTHDNLVAYPMWRAFKAVDEYNRAVIVVAAGNQEVVIGEATTYTKRNSNGRTVFRSGSYVYPASFEGLNNMISVSAVNASGNISSYSNTNADISAPGGDYDVDRSVIISTWISKGAEAFDGDIALKAEQGTSMAAPHVAGAAALLSAHDPDMTAYQIKQCILGSAASGGEGILDVDAAIRYQEYYGLSLRSEGTEGNSYSGWRNNNGNSGYDYDYDNYYQNRGKSSSSGGCNGFMSGAFAVMILFALRGKQKY